MVAPWIALGMAAVIAAPHTRVDASVETGAQARSAISEQRVGVAAALEVEPSLSARTRFDNGAIFTARYGPRLLLSSADPQRWLGVRHRAALSGEWSPAPGWALSTTERFSYGRTDVLQEAQTSLDMIDAQLVPIPDYLDASAELGFVFEAERGLTVSSAVTWWMAGALSAASQELLPLQHAPGLVLGLEKSLTPNDLLRTQLYADHTFVAGPRDASVVQVVESWRRSFSRTFRAELGAGLGAVNDERASTGGWGVLPVATLSLERDFLWRTERIETRLEGKLSPRVSSFSGVVHPRGEGSARVDWILQEKLRLRARVAGRRELWTGATTPESIALTELGASYSFDVRTKVGGGVRGIWGEIPALEGRSGFQWLAFTSLTVNVEDLF